MKEEFCVPKISKCQRKCLLTRTLRAGEVIHTEGRRGHALNKSYAPAPKYEKIRQKLSLEQREGQKEQKLDGVKML